jgi:murein DD-endopeptidase MepM/ murein hydrolase activator NlpD
VFSLRYSNNKIGTAAEAMELLQRTTPRHQTKRPDRREYTFMLIPHHGNNVIRIRIPLQALKIVTITLIFIVLATIGTIFYFRQVATVASQDQTELQRLRTENETQHKQIEQLAKATTVLQQNMDRLNQLDAELRRIVNNDDLQSSRAGINRTNVGYSGQGGSKAKPQLAELISLVQTLQDTAVVREQSLSAIKETIQQQNAREAATPTIWPASGTVTSRFGWRSSPFGSWQGDWHPGIDIANNYGTPIVATADGVVIFSGWYSGYGNMVQIDHGYGLETAYGHCAQTLVNVGTVVKKGDLIAYMGSTGYSTGPHVHYEVRINGTAVNPANYL